MKRLAFVLAALAFIPSVFAAGVDSRTYSCSDLDALIKAKGFVFLGNPDFQDFAVSDVYYCQSGGSIQLRSVVTRDQPECPVNYCMPAHGGGD